MRSQETINAPINCWPFGQLDAKAKQVLESVPKSRAQALAMRRANARLKEPIDARARPVTVNGITFPSVVAAATHFGVPRPTAQARVHRGWSYEDAVSVPTQKRTKRTIH